MLWAFLHGKEDEMDEKLCPVCKSRMQKDRDEWFCLACGYREKRKKKLNYRTKRDIQELRHAE